MAGEEQKPTGIVVFLNDHCWLLLFAIGAHFNEHHRVVWRPNASTGPVIAAPALSRTACPFLYYFVTDNKSGAKATPTFGTCNEVTSVKRVGNSISVKMRRFRGPFEPEAERKRAEREARVFIFRGGAVIEHVKRVK